MQGYYIPQRRIGYSVGVSLLLGLLSGGLVYVCLLGVLPWALPAFLTPPWFAASAAFLSLPLPITAAVMVGLSVTLGTFLMALTGLWLYGCRYPDVLNVIPDNVAFSHHAKINAHRHAMTDVHLAPIVPKMQVQKKAAQMVTQKQQDLAVVWQGCWKQCFHDTPVENWLTERMRKETESESATTKI